MVLWDEVVRSVIRDYPGLTVDWMLVDAMTQRMVNKPGSIDTVLATNLHADILSDLAAALGGSLGIGSTANIDPTRNRPSMFEPIHGSAFDIMGKGIANPLGCFWTACLMLDHLGEAAASARLMNAIEVVTSRGEHLSPDLGGQANTDEVTQAVIAALRGDNA
jgi:tartrate dehydrogenase/decarboxylase/D-malate dehydrogenase